MNRRFVSFFYNRSGHGEGGDAKAAAFVKGKTENPYAFMAAFKPDGTLVGETALYADKDAVFEWLRQLLVDHPEFAVPTEKEAEVFEQARAQPKKIDAQHVAAVLYEELGEYAAATELYELVESGGSLVQKAGAHVAGMRLARYAKQWMAHAEHEAALAELIEKRGEAAAMYRFEIAAERGYRLIAQDKFAEARALLQPLTKEALQSCRLAEMQFTCGVACWFEGRRDWAKFHWCWIVDHLPEDRLHRRAYIAAAAEVMPYPNYELRNYKADVGNIGTHSIVRGVEQAMKVYAELKPAYEVGEFDHGTAPRGLRQFR